MKTKSDIILDYISILGLDLINYIEKEKQTFIKHYGRNPKLLIINIDFFEQKNEIKFYYGLEVFYSPAVEIIKIF